MLVRPPHPNLWKFIDGLEEPEAMTDLDEARVMVGRDKEETVAQTRRNAGTQTFVGWYEHDGVIDY